MKSSITRIMVLPTMIFLLSVLSCSDGTNVNASGNEVSESANEFSAMAKGEMGQDEKRVVKYEKAAVSISGKISGAENGLVYLQIVESKDVRGIDTITAGPNGEYAFEYEAEIPQFYRVGVHAQHSFYLTLAPCE